MDLEQQIVEGIDVGNSDTKGSFVSIPTGYIESKNKLYLANPDDYMIYNSLYIAPSVSSRFPFVKDKTCDDRMLKLTLYTIAKDMLTRVQSRFPNATHDEIQEYINLINIVHLGVGLPPTHIGKLGAKYKKYYQIKNDTFKISYNTYQFSFKFGTVRVYPQGYATAATYNAPEESVLKTFHTYRIVDIGGFTVDITDVVDLKPDVANSYSLDLGINIFLDKASVRIENETGVSVPVNTILDIVKGKPTTVSKDIKEMVSALKYEWCDNLIGQFAQRGGNFQSYPTIFMGGGASFLKDALEKNTQLGVSEFISGVNRNADAYRKLLSFELKSNGVVLTL